VTPAADATIEAHGRHIARARVEDSPRFARKYPPGTKLTRAQVIPMLRPALMLLAALAVTTALAQDSATLEVKGRGAEGRPAYDGGGTVRFLDVALGGQVIHYDGGSEIALPLAIDYEVLETAPITLTSRFGTEHWQLYHFADETLSVFHTDEDIDLSEPGRQIAAPDGLRAWFGSEKYGPKPERGLVGIRGRRYFLIDPVEGDDWIDITDPPAWFDSPDVMRPLTFTLADLTEYTVQMSDFQSTWEAGGPLRVKVTITDAQGNTFPVVNAPLNASAGEWETDLQTHWGMFNEPTGWMTGVLPEDIPDEVAITGWITLVTPDGPEFVAVEESYAKGAGRVSAEEMQTAEQGYELPRNEEGVIRETRAVWSSTSDMETAEKCDLIVQRCAEAGLNTIIADIFVRNTFMAKSDLMPWTQEKWAEFDPLAYLIQNAHAAGLEVHPWFCVSYRDPAFNEWFEQALGEDVRVYDAEGEAKPLVSDVHREAYRDFMVDLMVGVARDYDVDGIHLDYIRTKDECYCEHCRAEFGEQFGKPITEATEEDWVAWQQPAIGDIVRRTAEGVHALDPEHIMSAAVFSSMAGGARQGQDAPEWARRGWVEVVIPMDYAMQSLTVRAHEREFLAALDDDDTLVTGLSLYQRTGTDVSSRTPELVREQAEMVRSMGIRGYCLFAFSHLSDEQLEMLRDEVNAEDAVPFFR